MSEPSENGPVHPPAEHSPVDPPVPLYPQDRLRISATYRPHVGDVVPPGCPESVDIIVNEPYGQGPDAAVFIAALVESLFRGDADVATTVQVDEQTSETVEEVPA